MIINISLYTYGVASAAYLMLCAMLLTQWPIRPLGPSLLVAAGATMIWACIIAIGTLQDYPPITLIELAELARNASWLYFLMQLLGFQEDGDLRRWRGRAWRPAFTACALIVLGLLLSNNFANSSLGAGTDLALLLWLSTAICGLLLVEQVYRNAREDERWGIKFLCLGLGAVFAYDFSMYAEALLFRTLNAHLWQARGIVAALVVPWLIVAIARNRNWRIELHISRHVVFHTVTLIGAGLYLLGMAVVGYFIKYLGGAWGGVLQSTFLAGSGALLVTLLFSGALRARLRVLLSKHFFSYRYDYRVEWLKFTEGLAALGEEAPEGIIRAMAPIALSSGGFLLFRSASGRLESSAEWELKVPETSTLGNLEEWVSRTSWVIDLREWHESPERYDGLVLPQWLAVNERLWLVVPLLFKDTVEGLLFLVRTDLKTSLNWEDRDLLKTAGRQAGALLAQQRASRALVEARQFDAFNRLSAYVIHDLKNILAQQSLIVANAKKHRENPAFIDDMISTVENSVKRMQRLMDQMRSGMRSSECKALDLSQVLQSAIAARSGGMPRPVLNSTSHAWVTADKERLTTVFSHLLQNAQEATPADGSINVKLTKKCPLVEVEIKDTGCGMSDSFLHNKLFKPFESTKGLTGMGIGAFESREYVRQLGGDIKVISDINQGTAFSVTLPLCEEPRSCENPQECDADTVKLASDVTH